MKRMFGILGPMVFLIVTLCSGVIAQKPGDKKAGPARDPKTGRFIKKSAGKHAGGKMALAAKAGGKKAGPARDPKTGRFIKKGAAK